jgi:hypothetical protein
MTSFAAAREEIAAGQSKNKTRKNAGTVLMVIRGNRMRWAQS